MIPGNLGKRLLHNCALRPCRRKGTQERIALFEGWVAQFRVTIPPGEFKLMASGYLAEIEKMHAEVMAYLSRHVSETSLPEGDSKPAPTEAS